MDVSWGLSAKVKLSDVVEECTGHKLEDNRSVKSMYSRLMILLRSFCGKDGKPGSLAFAGGWFLVVIWRQSEFSGSGRDSGRVSSLGTGTRRH